MDLATLLSDLAAEAADLDSIVAALEPDDWAKPTPAQGWTIAHQIGHLGWTDRVAGIAATDPLAFNLIIEQALSNPEGYVDSEAGAEASLPPNEILERWRTGRREVVRALGELHDSRPGERVPWFGPSMSPASMATARIMETWAHGQDVADALRVQRRPTDRLRHVAHIGVRARGFAYSLNGLELPDAEVRVELRAPDGEIWAWGPEDAVERVVGPALDFCLLVTQRRNLADLDVSAVGANAQQWLSIAQAFAGPPGGGRAPLG